MDRPPFLALSMASAFFRIDNLAPASRRAVGMSTRPAAVGSSNMTQRIRIASRASIMATAQVTWLMGEITRTRPDVTPEFVPITTTGDR
ncbi:hypothetical protein GCM10009578_064990 [Streptomyces rhizosphaericus]